MVAPRVPDDEFIRVWRKHNSTKAVALEIGSDEPNVRKRRRNLEKKYSIVLPQIDSRPRYNDVVINHSHSAEAKYRITDGVMIVGGDCHYWPGHVPTMHRAYVELCGELKPKAVVINGDAFDGASISRFASIGWESKPQVKDELDAVQARLSEIQKAAKGARRFWTAGNHDLRFESRLAAVASEYKGVRGIHLKDHFPEWIPCWFVNVNEDIEIRHREKGGVHASYNNTKESGVTMVTGHDHRADVIPYNDRRGQRYGVRHGMMAESALDPQFVHYLEGRRVNWQSGLAILTWHKGKLLMPELCLQIEPGKVQFRGKVYSV